MQFKVCHHGERVAIVSIFANVNAAVFREGNGFFGAAANDNIHRNRQPFVDTVCEGLHRNLFIVRVHGDQIVVGTRNFISMGFANEQTGAQQSFLCNGQIIVFGNDLAFGLLRICGEHHQPGQGTDHCQHHGNNDHPYLGALEKVGYKISVEDALKTVLRDKTFYEKSGGGLTVSGGEPMAQFEFTYALLSEAKRAGLHTCMETCGWAPCERYEKVAPLVDIFLFDYKISDSDEHKKYTGVPNEKIHENLRLLDSIGAKIILRCPIIPTVNDNAEHFRGIAAMANSLKNILAVDIEPYHPLGESKTEMLGKEYPLASLTFPEKSTVDAWIAEIAALTSVTVKKA